MCRKQMATNWSNWEDEVNAATKINEDELNKLLKRAEEELEKDLFERTMSGARTPKISRKKVTESHGRGTPCWKGINGDTIMARNPVSRSKMSH